MSVTAKTLINAKFAASTDTTEYTVASNTRTIIDKFTVTNTDTGAILVSVNIVPSGSTVSANNLIIKAQSVAASATADLTVMQNQILNSGDFISVVANTASKLVIRVSGREVT